MLKTDSEDEDEVVSSSFDRDYGVEVTHAETFVHSGRKPVIPVSSKEEGQKLEGGSEFEERRKQNCKTNLNGLTHTRTRAIRRPRQMTRIYIHASTYLESHSHHSNDTHYRSRVCFDDKVTHTHTHTQSHES